MKNQWVDPLTATILSPILFAVGYYWFASAFVASESSWWTTPFLPFSVHVASMWLAFRAFFVARFVLVPLAGFALFLSGGWMLLAILR